MKTNFETAKVFMDFYSEISEKDLPIRTTYKIIKLAKTLSEELKFYTDQAQKIIEECAEKDEKGEIKQENGSIFLQKDKIEECNAQLQELEDIEFDVPDIKLSFEELESCGISISLQKLNLLIDFIEE